MISSSLSIAVRFFVLIIVQGLVLNNVHVFGVASTYFYVIFILFLPIEFNRIVVILMAFALGLAIDLFSSSWGLHAFSCVFMAYLRPTLLRFLAPRDGYEFNAVPNWRAMGFVWFITYSSIAIFIHHFIVHFVEAFRFSEFINVLGRTLASTLFTMLLLLIFQLFSYKSNRN
jgi:rod shape-determining protein MreD|tara:strand:- start:118 stop:633 length:516 start_codon:yes stop_codon:yes gene_type:complete